MKKLLFVLWCVCLTGVTGFSTVWAQGDMRTIQFSGVVVDGEKSFAVPGVHVFIPRAGVGVVSNSMGYFSMPTMVGDTVVISAVGYKRHTMVIPFREDLGFSVMIDLKEDVTMLPVIEIFPYPSPEVFKEAFLALQLPNDSYENMAENLNQQAINKLAMNMAMDGSGNHRYFMQQQVGAGANRFFTPSFSFLNPFAWAQFIKSVKRGDLKRKD